MQNILLLLIAISQLPAMLLGRRARHRSRQMHGMNVKRSAIFDDSNDSPRIIYRTVMALALVLNIKLSGKRQGENNDGKKSNTV